MNVPNREIFDGSILENLTMGREEIPIGEVQSVLKQLELSSEIAALTNGLDTQMVSAGKQFSVSFTTKVALARLIIAKPKLLIFSDSLSNLGQKDRLKVVKLLTDPFQPWTLIVLSNDPSMMAACSQVLIMEDGQLKKQ